MRRAYVTPCDCGTGGAVTNYCTEERVTLPLGWIGYVGRPYINDVDNENVKINDVGPEFEWQIDAYSAAQRRAIDACGVDEYY